MQRLVQPASVALVAATWLATQACVVGAALPLGEPATPRHGRTSSNVRAHRRARWPQHVRGEQDREHAA